MDTKLADLIKKNKEKLVDRAATSLKVMFGVAYADLAQEELEDRLYVFFDALQKIAESDTNDTMDDELLLEVAESVMVSPIQQGWNNRAITEEVLRVVDFSVNKQIDLEFFKPEQAAEKAASLELLATVIRTAKDAVNGRARARMEKKLQKKRRGEPGGDQELREASLINEAGS